ncbi:hypothetical protein ACSTK8_24015, partial [Vibrio parahaemolyticus]
YQVGGYSVIVLSRGFFCFATNCSPIPLSHSKSVLSGGFETQASSFTFGFKVSIFVINSASCC